MDWVRKHSPLKSRNKPLPNTPGDKSPPRSPIKPISGNVSPSKLTSKLHGQSARTPQTRDKATSHPDQGEDSTTHTHTNQSTAQTQAQPKRIVRFRKSSRDKPSTEVYNLTKRVSSLEAQLEEARRELRTVVGSTISKPRVSSADIPRKIGVSPAIKEKRIRSADYTERHEPETVQTDVHVHSVAFTTKKQASPFKNHKADHHLVLDDEHISDQQHKRKRSELRQATWDQIQNHISDIQQQEEGPSSKRSKQSFEPRKPQYNKQLPPSPDAKEGTDRLTAFKTSDGNVDSRHTPLGDATKSKLEASETLRLDHIGAHESSRSAVQPDAKVKQPSSLEATSQRQIDDVFSPQRPGEKDDVEQEDGSTGNFYISRPPSPSRRYVPSPSRLDPVNEEFEWDDDEIF